MNGERIIAARKAAILINQVCTNLDIPLMIAGHDDSGMMNYNIFKYFKNYRNDGYKIAGMSAGGCNRDGMAIQFTAAYLEQRPETVKLMIVISDGRPNSSNYGGEKAKEDIQSIVYEAKKKGIETFAYAIGDDKDLIREIYKDKYIDISDLSKLPKIMANMIRKRIAN